ncbi:hypothetical protein D9615_004946 [Tricholomella constricta]|uniref:Nephrocystin 3-like N-terminal domain-containing protein n=1 Tax=Tricholomella constricta TaxID=117010 RepID=A0A8H5HH07_9AGAR|nr:hypothetical protein D9615_004946 [Tricholomella constricta]
MIKKPIVETKIPLGSAAPSSVLISAIEAAFPGPVKGGPVSLRLVVGGQPPTKLKETFEVKGTATPVKWTLKPNLSLKPDTKLNIQLRQRHHWPRNSTLLTESSISFQDAQEYIRSMEGKPYKLREKPTIFVEFNTQHNAFQTVMNSSVEKAQDIKSVLDHLGTSKRFLETLVGFSVALSEVDAVAKAVLASVEVVYRNLDEQDQCDKLILDLADSMARTLGYIQDVGQFARVYQLKRSIEEVTPLMEDTANFILMFTNRSNRAGFVHSWRDRDQVDELAQRYTKFKDQFDRGLAVQSGTNLEMILENIASAKGDELLTQLKPPGLDNGTPMGECMRGTREDIMKTIDAWIDNFDAPNILWVRGFPGVGKSAIASSLVARIRESHRLGSSFVFERSKSTVTTASALWRKVAYDLARAYPTVQNVVVTKLDEEIVQPGSSSVKMLFRNLIEESLNKSNDIPLGRLPVVVIDALDECGGLDGRLSADRVALLQSLKLWSRLPSRFKLVVTSRIEDDILRVLSPICSSIDISSGTTVGHQASDDIRLFLRSRFSKIARNYSNSLESSWPGDKVIDELTTRAAGLFIWAKTAIDFIDAGEPGEQLLQVLKGGTGLADVTTLYTHILNTSFKHPSQEVLHSFRLLIGSTILAKVPLHHTEYIDLLKIQPTMLDFIRNSLQSVMDEGDTLRFTHHSFVDFLIDPEKCPQRFLIDEETQQLVLTRACLQAMKSCLRFNICGLESSHIRNDGVLDLDARIKKFIPSHVSYACRFWVDHLEESIFGPSIVEEVGNFLNESFLYWLEALSLLKKLNVVVPSLWSLMNWLPDHTNELYAFAKDAIKFMAAFRPVIAQSVPHIYLSVLPFAPRNSFVYRRYSRRFCKTLTLQSGEVADWPAIQYIAEGHTNTVCSVTFSRNGKCFASGSNDNTVRIWDTETGSLIAGPFRGHRDSVNSVAFSHDDTLVVSGSSDMNVRVWDVETGDIVSGEFKGHSQGISSVAFSEDGRRVVSGSEDKTIRLWDVDTAKVVLPPFVGHQDAVTSVVFSPNQRHIVSGSHDRSIIVWDAKTGQKVAGPLIGHAARISSIAFSPDGTRLASGSGDWTVVIWDVATWTPLGEPLAEHIDVVTSVAFSPDGKKVASGSQDETIRIWDVQTGKVSSGPFRGHSDRVASVAFSWDGRRVASASYDKTIRVWDTAARNTSDSINYGSFAAHEDGVNAVAFSPDGSYIASGSDDLTVRIWDANTGIAKSEPFRGHTSFIDCIAICPDSRSVASGSDDANIFVWEVKTGIVMAQFLGHKAGVTSVAFSPDCTRVASSSYDKTVRIWDMTTGEAIHQPFIGHAGWVTSVAFSPDGKCVASGSYDDKIMLWDPQTGTPVSEPFLGPKNGINCIAFSPSGKHIASGSGNDIRIWDIGTRQTTSTFSGHTNLVVSLSYSPDGKFLASSSDDETIRIWDVENGVLAQEPLEGHSGGVDSVAFSPDGQSIVSGSEDESIRVWSVDKYREIASFGIMEQQLADDWKLQNGWVVSSDGSLMFWVPPWNRAGLWYPRNTTVIAELPTKLNFGQFVYGSSWQTCRDSLGMPISMPVLKDKTVRCLTRNSQPMDLLDRASQGILTSGRLGRLTATSKL